MPIIDSKFKPSWVCRNAHMQTVYPTLFRGIGSVRYTRQRILTSDSDFIDLDWSFANTQVPGKSLAVLCHGLEGCSARAYMMGMARACNLRNIDALAYNYRGCSGEPNLQKKFYTAGATDDLDEVITAIRASDRYDTIYLVGFSLGANLVLKYVGETGRDMPDDIKAAVAVSAPCDLRSSAIELDKFKNRLYTKRFLKMLCEKIKAKTVTYPELRDINLDAIRSLKEFDDLVTAPLSGFIDAEDYWYQASCIRVLKNTCIPVLILNAADDPILGSGCYPYEQARVSDDIFLEVPKWGGHVGFMPGPGSLEYWHEQRGVEFFLNTAAHLGQPQSRIADLFTM